MNYAVEMDSGAMMLILSFIKIGSDIQKLLGCGIHTQTHREQGDFISLLLFFQSKEGRLKSNYFGLWSQQSASEKPFTIYSKISSI
jgi:hypothetical protein